MARFTFGGTYHDWVARPQAFGEYEFAIFGAEIPVTFWDAPVGGNQLTDLMLNGSPATQILTDSEGFFPQFEGPDEVLAMWGFAQHPEGKRYLMVTTEAAIDLASQLATKIGTDEKGIPGGVATLGGDGYLVQPYKADGASGVFDIANIPDLSSLYALKGQLFINLADYPRIGTEGNDSPRIGRWIDDVIEANGIGWIPAGEFTMNTAVIRSLDSSDASITILGAGAGVSRLKCSTLNTGGALHFDSGEALYSADPSHANYNPALVGTMQPRPIQQRRVRMYGFSVIRDGKVGQGIGLKFNGGIPPNTSTAGASNGHHRSLIMRDVEVRGLDTAVDVFHTGIEAKGLLHPLLDNVLVTGPFTGHPVNGSGDIIWPDNSPSFVGTNALNISNSYSYRIQNSAFWNYYTGILDIGHEGEGGSIVTSKCVGVRDGIRRVRTAGNEPEFTVADCHINARDYGIWLDGVRSASIEGNLMYNVDTESYFTGVPNDIRLVSSDNVLINGNHFSFAECNPDRIHIDINVAGSLLPVGNQQSNNTVVINNVFMARGTHCVFQRSTAVGGIFQGNIFDPPASGGGYGQEVVDNADTGARLKLARPGTNQTALVISVDRSGVYTGSQTVSLGAVDSAGAGFRALRVPN